MRLKEHQYVVCRREEKNWIAVRTQESGHNGDWESANVRMHEEHTTKRKVLESIMILESNNTTNLDARLKLNQTWRPRFRTPREHSHEASSASEFSTTPCHSCNLNFSNFHIYSSVYNIIHSLFKSVLC